MLHDSFRGEAPHRQIHGNRKQISVCQGMGRDRNWEGLLMGLGLLSVVIEIK